MRSNHFGWCGKILRVDLCKPEITEMETMDYADHFLGGRGIATRIYWSEVNQMVATFDPENCMILMSGPLGATGVQGASRFEVVGKSPMRMPEGFSYGNLGGYFAPALKKAGYDGVVITGCAERPCYLFISDGNAKILDAAPIWGKGTYAVRTILQETHGRKVHFVTTGVAGENICRTATLITDHEGSATGGFGAVFGSKNFKSIAVVGAGKPAVARPDALKDLNRLTISLSKRGTLRIPLPKNEIRYARKALCYQCGLDCLRGLFKTSSGKEAVRKCQSMVFYLPWVLDRPEEKIDTAVEATTLCNDFSLCTMEMSNIITWLKACYESGYLTQKETGLDLSEIGSYKFLQRLVKMIAKRKGFGDLLAEGLLRTGQRLGSEAVEQFTDDVSDVGLGNDYCPRQYITTALLYAFEPRQPIDMLHEVSYMIARWLLHRISPELSPTSAEVFRAVATKLWGSDKAWDLTSYEGKALAAIKIQNRTHVKDSLILCDSAWPIMDSFNTPDHVGDPSLESKVFSAVTGVETDESNLNMYGERIFNLQRGIMLCEGWKALKDDMPAEVNFTDIIKKDVFNPQLIVPGTGEEPVSIKGNILARDKFATLRNEFYRLRGWDPATGLQKKETLNRLNLSDLAKDLQERKLVI